MSHVALVHIADWMADTASDYSVDTLLETVPRYGADAIPTTPTIYNEYEDDWCASGALPDSDDELALITVPLIAVRVSQIDNARAPYTFDHTQRVVDDLFRAQVQIAVRSTSPSANARTLSYYARASEASLWALGFATDTQRTVTGTGIRLGRVQSMARGPVMQQKGDLLAEVVISAVYALTETTPITV